MATVKETYKKRSSEINFLIKEIQSKLKKHESSFKKQDTNWGFVGDLGEIKIKLQEVNSFLK
jgi:hypothetical protein